VFFGWVLNGQLEGMDVSSKLLQEGDDVPCLTGEVQLPQLRASSSSRVPSGPAKRGGLFDLGEIKLGEDSAVPGRLRIGGGPSRSGSDLVEKPFDITHTLTRQIEFQRPQPG